MTMDHNESDMYQFVILDAQDGEPCTPEYYCGTRSHIAAYVDGYRWVKPGTLTGYDWLDREIDAQAAEYEEIIGASEIVSAV